MRLLRAEGNIKMVVRHIRAEREFSCDTVVLSCNV